MADFALIASDPPAGDVVDFALVGRCPGNQADVQLGVGEPPAGDAADLAITGDPCAGPIYAEPPVMVPPPAPGPDFNTRKGIAWADTPAHLVGRFRMLWGQGRAIDQAIAATWIRAQQQTAAWGLVAASFGRTDAHTGAVWGAGKAEQGSAPLAWKIGPPADTGTRAAWAMGQRRGAHASLPWQQGTPVVTKALQVWESTDIRRTTTARPSYQVPLGDRVDFALAQVLPPSGDAVDFQLGFVIESRTGTRTSNPFLQWSRAVKRDRKKVLPWGPGQQVARETLISYEIEPNAGDDPPVIIPPQGTYTVNNQVTVVRLPERTPIQCRALQASLDIDSAQWQVQLAISDAASFAALAPGSGGVREIEADVNGFVVQARITTARKSDVFGQPGWQLGGNGLSSELAEPAAAVRTYRQAGAATAAQEATDELAGTGWTLQWDAVDWVLPSGARSYRRQAPLQAIAELAETIGARVQPDPATRTLYVISRLPTNPVDYPSSNPDIAFPADTILRLDTQLQDAPEYNAVYVSGGQQGVSVLATRNGTAGDQPADDIQAALVTAVEAGQERGRVEIHGSGPLLQETLEAPILDVPGVALPGQLVEMTGALDWFGLVTAVDVAATINNDIINVAQRITVERQGDIA